MAEWAWIWKNAFLAPSILFYPTRQLTGSINDGGRLLYILTISPLLRMRTRAVSVPGQNPVCLLRSANFCRGVGPCHTHCDSSSYIVNLMEFRVTIGTQLWVYLLECFQVTLVEEERTPLNASNPIPETGFWTEHNEKGTWMLAFITQLPDCRCDWPTAWPFLTWQDGLYPVEL